MKKTIAIMMTALFSSVAFAQDAAKVDAAAAPEIKKLEEKGCSVNVTGIIAEDQPNGDLKVLIPYTGCKGDGKFGVVANVYSGYANGKWAKKKEAGKTDIERVTDFGGMASVTERIEYIPSKKEFVPPPAPKQDFKYSL